VKAAQHLVDASSFDVRAVEGELLPQLSAQAGVSRNVTYNDLPGVGSDYTERRNQATIGLNLSIPIYQGGRVSAQVRQAKESLGQARIEVDVARDQVRQLVTSAWTQYV